MKLTTAMVFCKIAMTIYIRRIGKVWYKKGAYFCNADAPEERGYFYEQPKQEP